MLSSAPMFDPGIEAVKGRERIQKETKEIDKRKGEIDERIKDIRLSRPSPFTLQNVQRNSEPSY
jgi:hypothetical protein